MSKLAEEDWVRAAAAETHIHITDLSRTQGKQFTFNKCNCPSLCFFFSYPSPFFSHDWSMKLLSTFTWILPSLTIVALYLLTFFFSSPLFLNELSILTFILSLSFSLPPHITFHNHPIEHHRQHNPKVLNIARTILQSIPPLKMIINFKKNVNFIFYT